MSFIYQPQGRPGLIATQASITYPPPGHLEKISTIYPGGGRGGGPARLEFFGFFCPNLQKILAFLLVCTMAPCCPRAPKTSTIYVGGG